MDRPFRTRRLVGMIGVALVVVALAAAPQVLAQETVAVPASASGEGVATSPASGPSTQPSVADVAWSDLQLLRQYIRASRLRDPKQRGVEYLKAREAVAAAAYLGEHVPPKKVEEIATLWPAIVSHYVEGFQRERLVVDQPSEREAVARITAVNPQDQQVAEELSGQIRQDLQKKGLSGQDLQEREKVLLKRKLAEQGIGYPLAATIQLRLVKVNDSWKLTGVNLVPPRSGAASRLASQPGKGAVATQPGQ